MNEQAPLALPPPVGRAHWQESELFSSRTRVELAGVNVSFLSLVAELHAARPGLPALGLPAHVVSVLSRCAPPPAVRELPYALFDLRFSDERFWRFETAAATSINDAHPARAVDPRLLRFGRSAVTLCWHLVQSEPRAARLALGIDGTVREVLAKVPVSSLDALARRVAPAVAARFCTRERFWQLVAGTFRFVPDKTLLNRLTLLGLQLQGADAARAQQLHRRSRR